MSWTSAAIRQARGDRGWTQRGLAERLGAFVRSVASWERDEATPQPHWAAGLDRLFPDEAGAHTTTGPTLAGASDAELLGEFLRRLTAARRGGRRGEPLHDVTDPDSHTDVTDGPPITRRDHDDDTPTSSG